MATFRRVAFFCLLFAYFETVFGAAPSPIKATGTTMTSPASSTGGNALVQSVPAVETVSLPCQRNDPHTIVVTSDKTQTRFITVSIADTKTVTKTVVITSVVTSAQTTRETEFISSTPTGTANSQGVTVTQVVSTTLIRTSTIEVLETVTLDLTLSHVQTVVMTNTLTTICTEISVSPIITSSP